MGTRLPRITGKERTRALKRLGWYEDYQCGSRLYLRHPDSPIRLTLPMHAGKTLKLGTLQGILKDAGLTAEQPMEVL